MHQPPLFESSPLWSVSDLTRYLRNLLESDEALQDIWVQGEVSNLSRPASGHMYFTLKDAEAALRCVMWRSDAARLKFDLNDGLALEAHGRISIYPAGGQYQLYVDAIRPLGEGALFQEFLRLKALLEAEGLFDPARKRPIPPRPRLIGIVTSPTGAALRDILNTLRRRYPLAGVVLAPSPVQGEEAPLALVAALNSLNQALTPDVILLARGGGSLEDLWAFNDQRVVRAIVASKVPVITGIGHETDFTLADFAADLRAPTPTAAAELATPFTLADLRAVLVEHLQVLVGTLQLGFERQHNALANMQTRLRLASPLRRVQAERQRLDDLTRRGQAAQVHLLTLARAHLGGLAQRLSALNPSAVLGRGYAILTHKVDKRLVASVTHVKPDDALNVRLSDGDFDVRVSN